MPTPDEDIGLFGVRDYHKTGHAWIVGAIVCDEGKIVEEGRRRDPGIGAFDTMPVCLRCDRSPQPTSRIGPGCMATRRMVPDITVANFVEIRSIWTELPSDPVRPMS
jgi:hypothetical protein